CGRALPRDKRARVARACRGSEGANGSGQEGRGRAPARVAGGGRVERVRGFDVSGDRRRATDSFEHGQEQALHGAQATAAAARKIQYGGCPTMNEKKKLTGFSNGTGPRGCEHGEELVAYIYGETSPVEANAFRQHLKGCAVCREELAAFGGVREAVGEWRAEVFGSIPSLNINESLAPTTDAHTTPARRRSAVAALREFFSLSPLWLQVGIAAAALVVCALAALTFARAEV